MSDSEYQAAIDELWEANRDYVRRMLIGLTRDLDVADDLLQETYLRMQAMESTLGSLIEGIRKYQNPALADLAQSVMTENSTNRDRLSQYLRDLAAQKEKEFQVADREAQRCRGMILNQPTPKGKSSHP